MMIFRQWLRTFFPQDRAKMRTGILVAATAAALAMPAAAQDTSKQGGQTDQSAPAGQPEWIKICTESPKDKSRICVVTRERRAATGQLLAAVSLREIKDKKILVTAVPPGMLLRPGLQIQIDDGKPTKATYSICFPNLCFAEMEVKADYVASMKRGNNLIVTTLTQQAKPIKFDISLTGFTKSYDGAAIDPKKLQDDQKKLQQELKRKAEAARKKLIEKQREKTSRSGP